MPLARATGIGSTAAWADHSKSVCRRQSSTISSPVMVSVVTVMDRDAIRNGSGLTMTQRFEVARSLPRAVLYLLPAIHVPARIYPLAFAIDEDFGDAAG